jgi:hypothetical protein
MWSTLFIGGTGSGKSRSVENKVISALSGGDTVYWYLDPNGGGSSPALAEHADWFVTTQGAQDMLNAALAILNARGEENAVEGWTGFTPSPQRPGLLIVVEECHVPFGDSAMTAGWTRIAREGRKLGVSLVCASQYPGLETFGGSEAMRLNVMAGNVVVFNTLSNSTGQLMPGLEVDPKTLPMISGYGYVQGSAETGTRTAPFRNRLTDLSLEGERTSRWLAAQPRPSLDTLAATATLAAGTAYRDRHDAENSTREASAARVKMLREGHLPEGMIVGTVQQQSVPMGEMGEVIAFPGPVTLESLRSPAQPAAAELVLSPSHLAVLQAVAAGATRPSEVEKAVDLSPRRVATLLKELVVSKHLTQPSYGRYQRAA